LVLSGKIRQQISPGTSFSKLGAFRILLN